MAVLRIKLLYAISQSLLVTGCYQHSQLPGLRNLCSIGSICSPDLTCAVSIDNLNTVIYLVHCYKFTFRVECPLDQLMCP